VRKTLVQDKKTRVVAPEGEWLNLENIAQVEVTSEDPNFPIENALVGTPESGWRAAEAGPQVIRLCFDTPEKIRRIQLHFVEKAAERSQEFAIFADSSEGMREIRRQQWNFSPHGESTEIEDFTVELDGVKALELRIDPDRSHDPNSSRHFASLQRLRVA
jgi:hypothetical protein